MKTLIHSMKKTRSINHWKPKEKLEIEKLIWTLLVTHTRLMLKQKNHSLLMFLKSLIVSVINSLSLMVSSTEKLVNQWMMIIKMLTHQVFKIKDFHQVRESQPTHHKQNLQSHQDLFIHLRICISNSKIKIMHILKTSEVWVIDNQSSNLNPLQELEWFKDKIQATTDKLHVLALLVVDLQE